MQKNNPTNEVQNDFIKAFHGSFIGILRWPQLDEFWQVLQSKTDEIWYIYAIGEPPPEHPVSIKKLQQFIQEINTLLRKEHQEDYCGIVYVDDKSNPNFVKIFDPNNLGVSCGYSENPPLPGWIISHIKPVDLKTNLPQTGSRKRWWQNIFGG